PRDHPPGSDLVYYTAVRSSGNDLARGIALNAANEAFVTGETANGTPPFPTTAGAFDTIHNAGVTDAFVLRLTASGSGLVYSTFLGGQGDDVGRGIAVDAADEAFVTGNT